MNARVVSFADTEAARMHGRPMGTLWWAWKAHELGAQRLARNRVLARVSGSSKVVERLVVEEHR